MKKTISYSILSLSLITAISCGPAGDKEMEHSNHPKIENDGYYRRDNEEPSTNPAFTTEGDTARPHGDRNKEDEMEGKK